MRCHDAYNASTILVTGSSGRIGSAIVASLRNDYSVIGLDIIPGPYTTHIMDIQETEIIKILRKSNIVVHTAALHAPHVGIYDEK